MFKKKETYRDYEKMLARANIFSDYYPRGIASLLDIVHAKTLRMYSVLEAMENDKNYEPNFESLEDSAKDLINYGSFIAAYIRGGIDGQSPQRDFLNRKIDMSKFDSIWDPQETEVHVSGVPYKVDRSILSKSVNAPYQKLNTEPTYIGDNHWLRSDGTKFKSENRPKPKDKS